MMVVCNPQVGFAIFCRSWYVLNVFCIVWVRCVLKLSLWSRITPRILMLRCDVMIVLLMWRVRGTLRRINII